MGGRLTETEQYRPGDMLRSIIGLAPLVYGFILAAGGFLIWLGVDRRLPATFPNAGLLIIVGTFGLYAWGTLRRAGYRRADQMDERWLETERQHLMDHSVEDLADDELFARLVNTGMSEHEARLLVDARDAESSFEVVKRVLPGPEEDR